MGLTGGKSGGKNALAAKPNLLNALQVQTSSYGQVIPILYGQTRLAGRLLWAGDFTAIPHTSTTKVGGKGLGSGGGNVSNTSYTYQTAVAIAICMGPIQSMGNVWDTKGKLTLLNTSQQFTVPGGGGSFTPTPPSSGVWHSGRGVSRADSYSVSHNDYGSDGSATFAGTQQTPMVLVGSSPGAGQYTLNTSNGQHTFSGADAGKVMTITYAYSVPNSNSNGVPATQINLTLFLGSKPQTPWTYLTSVHPGQDLGYNSIAYVASSAMDLGESGSLPNLSYEILGLLPFGAGITDAEPSAIISDLINNAIYGLNGIITLDVANTVTAYRNFCVANGIFISPVFDSQQSAAKCIQDILDITNAAAVLSEGVLKIISYGDTTAVGNGATFTPNTSPIYDLSSNDFLDVVKVKRPSVADVMNSVSVEWVDRSNDYNVSIAEDKDDAMIAVYGLRKAQPTTAHAITTSTVAKFVANLLRKRQVEIRATYTVKLGWQFNLLEPMDLVTITVPELGYSKKPVRITAIREDDTGQLEIDAEDFPWGTATPTLYGQQPPGNTPPRANADPGPVNTPIMFEANDRLSLTGNYEVWIGVCGSSADWGGCSVWVSPDGTNYVQVGRIYGPARMGSLSANLASAADPDTTHTLSVDLTASAGTLSGGSQADCDNFRLLCFVDGELISFQTATLTSAFHYNLATRLRRGVFGSPITSHSSSVGGIYYPVGNANPAVFLRLDDAVFVWEADPTLVALPTNISGASNASPISITDTAHGYTTGQTVLITGVGGNTAANGTWVITVVDANHFTLNGSTGNGAYTSGGTASGVIFFKFTSINKYGLMEQSLANATAYPFNLNGMFGNHDETPANNATLDSVFNSGTSDSIRVYGPGGVGTSYNAWKQKDQSFNRTIPAQTITSVEETGASPQTATLYYISYDFQVGTHRAWFNINDYVQAVYRGQMRVGSVFTVDNTGSGGTTGGQGSGGGGGGGSHGRPLPPM